MLKKLSLVAAAGLLAGLSPSSFAGHNGGPGGHLSMGGMSSQHMSTPGFSNTNGPNAVNRETGLLRADDRRNAEAAIHERADNAQAAHKHPKMHGKHSR